MTDVMKLLQSMENTIKLQSRADAERRARRAEQEQKEFMEKLRQAAVSKAELDGMASKVKGSEDAMRRDQLIGMIL